MNTPIDDKRLLQTTVGDFPLDECRIKLPDRELTILHVAAILTDADESHFLLELENPLPYGIALWSSTVALAQELILRAENFSGKQILELGAGTGLPGIVAASLKARKVVQTDRNNLSLTLCKRNCELNDIKTIEHRLEDWTNWDDTQQYDLILGSDILYAIDMHEHLRRIFESNLAPEGTILLSDPFRGGSLRLLEALEKNNWSVEFSKWTIGQETATSRSIAVYRLSKK